MYSQPQADFELRTHLLGCLNSSSDSHDYSSVPDYQDTVEAGTVLRQPSATQPGLVQCYWNVSDDIAAPFVAEVFPKREVSYAFFKDLSPKVLAGLMLSCSAKNADDPVVKEALESVIEQESPSCRGNPTYSGMVDEMRQSEPDMVVDSGSIEAYLAANSEEGIVDPIDVIAMSIADMNRQYAEDASDSDVLGSISAVACSAVLPAVERAYEHKLFTDLYDSVFRVASRGGKARLATSKAVESYKKEYGSSALSEDIKRAKELVEHDLSDSDRERKIETLSDLIGEFKDPVDDMVNDLRLGDDLEDFDDAKIAMFDEQNAGLREAIAGYVEKWYCFTSGDVTGDVCAITEAISMEKRWVNAKTLLSKFEDVIKSYADKEMSDSESSSQILTALNRDYLDRIFSESNIAADIPVLVGEDKISVPDGMDIEGMKSLVSGVLDSREVPDKLDIDFVASVYTEVLARYTSQMIAQEHLEPIMISHADQLPKLVDEYVTFKARKTFALRENSTSTVRDIVYGDDFSYILHTTTGSFMKTGNKNGEVLVYKTKYHEEKMGARDGPVRFSRLSLSDAIAADSPSFKESVDIIYKVCDSLNILHRNGVEHGGLTLENVLLSEDVDDILLTGYNPEQRHVHSCFSVPEIRNKDILSAVVMLYSLLIGDVPFSSSEPDTIMKQLMDRSYVEGMSALPRRMRKMISKVFNKVVEGSDYSIKDFKKDLAKASGKSTSRSYFNFKDYRKRINWEHLKQVNAEIDSLEDIEGVIPMGSGNCAGPDISDTRALSENGGATECRVGNHVYTGVSKMSVGGSAEVFEATLHDFGYPVVLKKLRDHKPSDDLSQEAIDFLKQKFASEAVLSFQLQSANVIKPVNYSASEGVMVFERIDGLDLRDVDNLVEEGLSEIEAMVTAEWACYALEEAHSKGIVHRDISPGNIMIQNKSFRALLADFGVAATKDDFHADGSAKSNVTPGTRKYRSPEQIHNQEIDGRSDIYGMGMVLKEIFIRRDPTKVDMDQKKLPMSKDAAEICRKATMPSSVNRYKSVEKLREGIKEYLFKRGISSIEDMESVLEGVLKKAYSPQAKEYLKRRIEDDWNDSKYVSDKLDKSTTENDVFRGVAEQRRDITDVIFEDDLIDYVNRHSSNLIGRFLSRVREVIGLPRSTPNSQGMFSSLKKVHALSPEEYEQAYTDLYKRYNGSEEGRERFRQAFSDYLSQKLGKMAGGIATIRKIDHSGYSDIIEDVEKRVESVIKMFASKQFLKVDTDMQRQVRERFDRALRNVEDVLMQLDPENKTYVRLAKKIEKKIEDFSTTIEKQENGHS